MEIETQRKKKSLRIHKGKGETEWDLNWKLRKTGEAVRAGNERKKKREVKQRQEWTPASSAETEKMVTGLT